MIGRGIAKAPIQAAFSIAPLSPPLTSTTWMRSVKLQIQPDDETDLSFADLDGDKRRNTATDELGEVLKERNYAESMARREGFEPPTLRFEA